MNTNTTTQQAEANTIYVLDAWANILTGLGVAGRDKRLSSRFGVTRILDQRELSDIYRSGGFGRRIIDLTTSELIREWFVVQSDDKEPIDPGIQEVLKSLQAKEKIADLIRWGKLYGGAIGVLIANDGNAELTKPLNTKALRSVEGINVFDRYSINFTNDDLYKNPNHPKFQEPEFYEITSISTGSTFRVHETRCLRMDGAKVPEWDRQRNNGWGDSELQKCYERLRGLSSAYDSVEFILDDFVQMVLEVKNLSQMLASGQEDLIRKRLNILDLSRHIAHIMIVDTEENYEKKTSSVAGLSDLIRDLMLGASAVSGIPVTRLFGQAPAGLNATGDSDIRNFYDEMASDQETRVEPIIKRLVQLVMLSRDGFTKGKEPKNWSIRWNPLWQLSEKEEAEMRAKIAEADIKYIEQNVLTAEEVRKSRFGGDRYSLDTAISDRILGGEPQE